MAHGLERIDWQAAWLAPYGAAGSTVTQRVASGMPIFAALNRHIDSLPDSSAKPAVRFVEQSDLPPGLAYESYIYDSKQCPILDGLHDFFNGLCWIHFPKTKKRLNQLQAAQIANDGIGQVRGPVRDAITVFDENAAFLRAPDDLWDALVAKDWQTLFVRQRALWQEARLTLFGHALLEKLVSPRKGITAHVYRVRPATDSMAGLDEFVASDLSAERLAAKPFAHLPVLGVPGWWPANENPHFYDDKSVFRLLRAPTEPARPPSQNLTFHGVNP